ncbi:hypothetical protein Patl1_32980 [Pistacia atlantica]|uniref:Uncharacterized protein n=1 Tax=Pistacia atlantica TaxID=434234 RepID=A0ACC1AMA1_9ROSI|nr:hypothetical protein Patl1_32980 [Pistacia atlantica]
MAPNRTNKRLPKFFKVFIPRLSSASLKIPYAWVQHLNALPKNVVLQNQIRKIWHMKMEYADNRNETGPHVGIDIEEEEEVEEHGITDVGTDFDDDHGSDSEYNVEEEEEEEEEEAPEGTATLKQRGKRFVKMMRCETETLMQGLHHRQQQLAALLSVALSKDDSTSSSSSTINATATVTASTTAAATSIATTTTTTTTASGASNSEDEDSARLGAITSLHRLIIYPPNSVVITHSASFLSQGFSQLLTDKKFYEMRQSAAVAYGALCAVVCSIPIGSNGRQNYVMLGSMVDRFIGWALPLLSNVSAGDGTTDWLWKDYFSRFFEPHFLDIVDLLLGWALVPDLAESDRDGSHGTPQQFRRLLALLSCFSTVLQSTASGLLEMNLLEQISERISKMLPSVVGIFINGSMEVWLVKMDWGFMEVLDSLGRNITQKLRLHPNHLITGISAATYVFLLQHGNNEVVQQAESVELQISVIKTLEKLTAVEFLSNISLLNQSTDNASVDGASKKVLNGSGFRDRFSAAIVDHMKKNKELMVKALNFSSPLGVKVDQI